MTSVRTPQRWFVLLALAVFALAVVAANHNFAASQAQAAAQADLQPPGPSAAPPETLPVVMVAEVGGGYALSTLVQAANLDLIGMWSYYGPLRQSTSTDDGATWSLPIQVQTDTYSSSRLLRALDDTLWLVVPINWGDIWYRTSSDNGTTWSPPVLLDDHPDSDYMPDIAQTSDGRLWVVWISYRSGSYAIWYKTSADGGATWSAAQQLTPNGAYPQNPTIAQAGSGDVWVVWSQGNDLWYRTTSDAGVSWSPAASMGLSCCPQSPSLAASEDGVLWLAYTLGEDIWYRSSADNGATWSAPVQFTRWLGRDIGADLAPLSANRIGLVWQSERTGNTGVWFGILGEREDITPPPIVRWVAHLPQPNPTSDDAITFRGLAQDETGIAAVHLVWTLNGVAQPDLPMYDDGQHGDLDPGDGVYGVVHPPLPADSLVNYRVRATDIDGGTYTSPGRTLVVLTPFVQSSNILLVVDESSTAWYPSSYTPYFADALGNLGYSYDLWDTVLRGQPNGNTLNAYANGVIVWATPTYGNLHSGSVPGLMTYLNQGGKLFITGQNVAEYLRWEYPNFLVNYLYAAFVRSDTGIYNLNGAIGDPIGDGLALNISGAGGANNQYSKDEVAPIIGASVVLTYGSSEASLPAQWLEPGRDAGKPDGNILSGVGGLRVDTGVFRVVFFSFGFEGINNAADRSQVMERVVTWLGCSAAPGDFNCDGQVTTADLVLAAGAWGQPNARFDLDGDGEVTIVDIMLAAALWEG